jgi:hypothetical protein
MINGTLKYGISNNSISQYFFFININDNGFLLLNNINVIFISEMDSMIYMGGGSVCIEYMKIINEEWIKPLIEVNGNILTTVSSIKIEIYMCTINECNYTYTYKNIEKERTSTSTTSTSTFIYKSGVIFISKSNSVMIKDLLLNISNCLFNKNIVNLFYNDSGYGSICRFSNVCEKSSMMHFFLLILFINSFIILTYFFKTFSIFCYR